MIKKQQLLELAILNGTLRDDCSSQISGSVLPFNNKDKRTIPGNAAVKIFKKKAEVVTLEGPSGDQWLVGLSKILGQLYFKEGWKEFVKVHYAEEGDVLIFTYCVSSCLSVLIFDRSGCERESSYFVKYKNHILTNGCQTKLVNCKRQLLDALECSSTKLACDDNSSAQVISVDDKSSSFRVDSGCTIFNMRLSSRKEKFNNGMKLEKNSFFWKLPLPTHLSWASGFMAFPYYFAVTHLQLKPQTIQLRYRHKIWPA